MWVHWALNAVYRPSAGQLTISFRSRYSLDPPTGTSAAAPSSTGAVGVAGVSPPLLVSVEQAASVTPAPAAPASAAAPLRTVRRAAGCGAGMRFSWGRARWGRYGRGAGRARAEPGRGTGPPDDTAAARGTFPA